MSVKISLLKKSKQHVTNWLNENYEGGFNVFYSLGTKQKDFKDQFLKIELDCNQKKFSIIALKLRHELLTKDMNYSELRFKIFPLTVD